MGKRYKIKKGRSKIPLPKHTVFLYDINCYIKPKENCVMESIVTENLVSFKELEKKIFQYVCELGRKITRIMLENYDRELAEGRDKKQYRNKGKRSTTIKTVYGEVTYGRNVYRTKTEDGETAYIYLLDEAMHMDKIGLISTNLAEKIAMTITESPYRATADTISSTCGPDGGRGCHTGAF